MRPTTTAPPHQQPTAPPQQPCNPAQWEIPPAAFTTAAIHLLKNRRAADAQGVCAEMLKYGGIEVAAAVHAAVTSSFQHGAPAVAKTSDLLPLPKKGDPELCTNKRGIQIISMLRKVMGTITGATLSNINEQQLLEWQCGFRRSRGCRDQLFTLRLLFDEAAERKRQLVIVFVDLKKAFDSIDRQALMVVLQRRGVPPELVEVMRDLHTDTSARVRWRGQRSAPFSMEWGAQQGCPTANPLFNAFINIIVEEALNSLGNSCGVEVLWKVDNRLHRPPQPDGDAQHLLVTLLMLADDLAVAAESVEQAQRVMDALEAATQRWGMEISLQKTEAMVLDPRRSKAAQPSRDGSIQSAPQPGVLMPLLSLLLIAVLAIALPLPPPVCIIAATGLCCCVVLVRILLALSYSLSSHSPSLPAAIPTSLPAALRRQQPAANHHHQPPNAQPQLQPTASPLPTAPRPISLRGHELPYVQHFRYLGSYFSADCSLDKEISWRLTAAGAAVQRAAKLWRSRDISTRTKTRIYGSLVLSVLLYGAESWPITPSQLQRLEVFHRRCLRSILGVRRRDGISIEELLRRTQLCSIGTTIRRLRLRWLGHVMRMPGERVARQVLFGQLRGTRPVGSPPVTLRGLMRKDVLLLNGGGGQVHGRRWYQQCMEKAAWRTSVDSVL